MKDFGTKLDAPIEAPISDNCCYPSVSIPYDGECKVGDEVKLVAMGRIKSISETGDGQQEITLDLHEGELKESQAKTVEEAFHRAKDKLDKKTEE